MTPIQQKAFEDRLSKCTSDGWKDLLEELKEFREVIDTVNGVKTMEELFIRQGKLELIQWMESLHNVSRETYETLRNEVDK